MQCLCVIVNDCILIDCRVISGIFCVPWEALNSFVLKILPSGSGGIAKIQFSDIGSLA